MAGILLIPALGSQMPRPVALEDTPLVLLDRIVADATIDAIGVNNAEASADVIRRLVMRGNKRLLVAYMGEGLGNVSERLQGVRRAVAEAGEQVTVDYLPTGNSVEGARAALDVYLSHNAAPDAVFCLFNTATLAAYGLLQERGLAPGEATALVSFDDSAWMAHVHPPVAAIVQPTEEIAERAWARLLARVRGGEMPFGVERVACRLEARGAI